MPRPATHQTLRHHHNLLLLCVFALFVVLGFIAFKYLWIKETWYEHSVKLSGGLQKYETANSVEDGKILAATIVTIPSGFPLLKQPAQLQKYVAAVSTLTGRDIVILSKNKTVLADTIPANVGKAYTEDNGVVDKTLADGEARSFIERSTDYPNGIKETVIQMKDTTGTIIGALIISSSNIFK